MATRNSARINGVEVSGDGTFEAPQKASANPGGMSAKQYLKDTQLTIGNTRSGEYKPTKTSGITVRGGKAQTKGKTARGPMA